VTFGQYISAERKKISLSQKDLAQRIHKEDGQPISAQYLNDIEHDRRSPGSDYLIEQFAKALKLDKDYLYYLAGEFPADLREHASEERIVGAIKAFRRALKS
jgi:transcriptional regulator with XRE-family HTH domain